MNIRCRASAVAVFALAAVLLSNDVHARAAQTVTLVVPARHRMIELALDMEAFRGARLVSYRWAGGDAPLYLFEWAGTRWTPVSLDAFARFAANRPSNEKLVFLGTGTPPLLMDACAGTPGVVQFETFDLATLVNNLDILFSFTSSEWRYLSNRYNFILRDLNAQRRLHGRFGAPGQMAEPPPHEDFPDGPIPPAEVLPRLSTPAAAAE